MSLEKRLLSCANMNCAYEREIEWPAYRWVKEELPRSDGFDVSAREKVFAKNSAQRNDPLNAGFAAARGDAAFSSCLLSHGRKKDTTNQKCSGECENNAYYAN